jgi:hypothetical protein
MKLLARLGCERARIIIFESHPVKFENGCKKLRESVGFQALAGD